MANLKERYQNEVAAELKEQFSYANVMQVPRITKVTLNMGIGEAVNDKKLIDNAIGDLEKLSGQKPLVTKARKSIAGFKVREGWPIGIKVTLRAERMWDFLDRLVYIAIPRVRDFRGRNPSPLTVAAITLWVCVSRSSSRRSSMIRSIASGGWTSLSLRPPTPTRKVVRF